MPSSPQPQKVPLSPPASRNSTNENNLLAEKDYAFVSSFPLPLIHRILLTDPDPADGTFPNLTVNSSNNGLLPPIMDSKNDLDDRRKKEQVYFHSFIKDRGFPIIESTIRTDNDSIPQSTSATNPNTNQNQNQSKHNQMIEMIEMTKTIQRAFNDSLIHQMQSSGSYQPLQNLLLEVHADLRSLIPNRQDLHHILLRDDDVVRFEDGENSNEEEGEKEEENGESIQEGSSNKHRRGGEIFLLDSLMKMCTHLKKIGVALCMLESEYRSETTKQWMNDILLAHVQKLRQLEFENENDRSHSNIDSDSDIDNDAAADIQTSLSSLSSRSFNSFHNEGIENGETAVIIVKPSNGDDSGRHDNYNNDGGNGDGDHQHSTMSMTTISFVLASTTFLHYKAELCKSEAADFQFSHILAPRINNLGKQYIYQLFQEKFGGGDDHEKDDTHERNNSNAIIDNLPNTKAWVEEMIQSSTPTPYSLKELCSSEEKRAQTLQQTGWIDNILFRSAQQHRSSNNQNEVPSQPPSPPPSPPSSPSSKFLIPEVLWLDMTSIRDIRQTTKISVVGSVLALHATSTAGVNDSALKKDPLDAVIENCRKKLAAAMSNSHVRSQGLYENNIVEAVVDLAKALNPLLSNSAIESLQNRTKATLKGQDPVIQLLDNRMRSCFRTLVVSNPLSLQQVPKSLKTGRNLFLSGRRRQQQQQVLSTSSSKSIDTFDSAFKRNARQEFIKKGFAFYSNELSEASLLATKSINLVLSIYGIKVIEKLFVQACQNNPTNSKE